MWRAKVALVYEDKNDLLMDQEMDRCPKRSTNGANSKKNGKNDSRCLCSSYSLWIGLLRRSKFQPPLSAVDLADAP